MFKNKYIIKVTLVLILSVIILIVISKGKLIGQNLSALQT